MPAYPVNLPQTVLPQQTDGLSTVNAVDVNLAYDEINQIAATLALNPQNRANAWGVGSFSFTGDGVGTTVKQRIENVENGAKAISDAALVKTGNQVVTVTNNAHTSFTVQAKASQTANLFEAKNDGGTVNTSINPAGYIVTIDGGDA